MDTEYDYPAQSAGNGSAQVIQIDASKHLNWAVWCVVFCSLSFAGSVWAILEAKNAATEARLTQYYLMDPHSRTPDELAAWAKFNREKETH